MYEKINNIKMNKNINYNIDNSNINRSFAKLECNRLNNYNPLNIKNAVEICIQKYK
jgi:hypothetical protein